MAVYEGAVLRNGTGGKVLGLSHAQDIVLDSSESLVDVRDVMSMTHFVLVGDELVMLALNRIFSVTLAETVMRAGRLAFALTH